MSSWAWTKPHVGVGGGTGTPPGQEFNLWRGLVPPDRHLIECRYRQLVPPPKKKLLTPTYGQNQICAGKYQNFSFIWNYWTFTFSEKGFQNLWFSVWMKIFDRFHGQISYFTVIVGLATRWIWNWKYEKKLHTYIHKTFDLIDVSTALLFSCFEVIWSLGQVGNDQYCIMKQ